MIYDIGGALSNLEYSFSGGILKSVYDIYGNAIKNGVDSPYIEGRKLIFEDDFNTLDLQYWSYELGDVRNRSLELQCYKQENVTVEDSMLVLTAKKEAYGGKTWTSGSITGQRKQKFQYGRFEARIKFPDISGGFGAFWLLGSNFWYDYVDGGIPISNGVLWPKCGEIDIVETIPGKADNIQGNIWKYSGGSYKSARSQSIELSDWHIYGVELTETQVEFFVDDNVYMTITGIDTNDDMRAYRLPMYMILNLAVGSYGGTPADDLEEIKMYVDWVRVHAPISF